MKDSLSTSLSFFELPIYLMVYSIPCCFPLLSYCLSQKQNNLTASEVSKCLAKENEEISLRDVLNCKKVDCFLACANFGLSEKKFLLQIYYNISAVPPIGLKASNYNLKLSQKDGCFIKLNKIYDTSMSLNHLSSGDSFNIK